MTTLHAQPYDLDAHGFYFTSAEDYETKAAKAVNIYGLPVEEFEIQFIDGDDADAKLFDVCGIDQTNLETWFDRVEYLDERDKVALFYLMDCNISQDLDDALDDLKDVQLFNGRLLEAATEIFDEIHLDSIPEKLRGYIDYEAYANDLDCNGDLHEFEFCGETWTCTNANS